MAKGGILGSKHTNNQASGFADINWRVSVDLGNSNSPSREQQRAGIDSAEPGGGGGGRHGQRCRWAAALLLGSILSGSLQGEDKKMGLRVLPKNKTPRTLTIFKYRLYIL